MLVKRSYINSMIMYLDMKVFHTIIVNKIIDIIMV